MAAHRFSKIIFGFLKKKKIENGRMARHDEDDGSSSSPAATDDDDDVDYGDG